MSTQIPVYTDLALHLSYLEAPFDLIKVEKLFNRYFENVKTSNLEPISLNFEICNASLIKSDGLKNHTNKDYITPTSSKAVLLNSNNTLYLLINIGENHIIGSSIINYLKNKIDSFVKISPGRFINNLTEIIISLEEDEFGAYFLLVSNNQSLISMDELFNFSREITNDN
jgi:hypothetical protein